MQNVKNVTYIYDDGGRDAEGYRVSAVDCAVRAMAIALQIPYKQAHAEIATRKKRRCNLCGRVRKDVPKKDMSYILAAHGYKWFPAPIFAGRRVAGRWVAGRYAYAGDMPAGRIIVKMDGNYAAIIDGVLHDTFDSSQKMIWGYWAKHNSGVEV